MEQYKSLQEILDCQSKPKIIAVVKVGKEEHLKQLAHGNLRFRHLGYFQGEETKGNIYHDSEEGIHAVLQGDQVNVTIGPPGSEHTMSSEGGLVDVKIYMHQEQSIFCLHAIHTGDWRNPISEAQLQEFKDSLQITAAMSGYGAYVLVIKELGIFNERIMNAAKKLRFGIKRGLVKYADFSLAHGTLPEEYAAFVKNEKFKDEREYRYQILCPDKLSDPFNLDVGDLSDITVILSLDEFRRLFSIRFPKEKLEVVTSVT